MSNAERLRITLSKLDGPARARPLLELAQALSDDYWKIGPGKPEGLPPLDEAIAAVDEAHGHFRPGDGMRQTVACMRGWLHATRHLAHFGPEEDRKIGLDQLEDGLHAPNLPPMVFAMCQITLGQLYLSNVKPVLQAPDIAARIMSGGMPASAVADVDRAIACFEQVRSSPAISREALDVAELLIRMAGAMRTIVTSPSGGSGMEAINRIMEAMAVIQDIHQEQSRLAATAPVGGVAFYHADRIADAAPLDRPVPLVEVEEKDAPARRTPTRPASPRDADQPAALRRELRARVSAGGDLFEALEALLDPAAAAPPIGLVDDVVALATAVVDAGAANRTDHLLLAAGLCLRARAAGARWVRRDLEDATESLLQAAGSARPAPPETVRVMRRLAAMVDAVDPGCRAQARLAEVSGRRPGGR